ncbi:hypothetical protein RJ55_03342 [Drechmeria coniospora]|nr:hypothetical protein RJ55_03342 [Drechmeria coniospora]
MEQVHGVDVSWMTQGSPRDKQLRPSTSPPNDSSPARPRSIPTSSLSARNPQGTSEVADRVQANGQPGRSPSSTSGTSTVRRMSRSGSMDKQQGGYGTSPQRRNSWFSTISAKFSSSSSPASSVSHHHSLHHLHLREAQDQEESGQELPPQYLDQPSLSYPADQPPPKLHPNRNAVLQHAAKPDGNGPYTPAPPKSAQAGILGVLRRLSSSGGSGLANVKLGNGLVDRVTLNVDRFRERCPISELKDAKLRRVSFCVDVEIAPLPKYSDAEVSQKPSDKAARKKGGEKGEGEALKAVEAKAAEAKAAETKSVESKSAETKSAETKSAESKSAETKSAESKSAESKSAESKSAESKAVEFKSAESKSADTKSAEARRDDAESQGKPAVEAPTPAPSGAQGNVLKPPAATDSTKKKDKKKKSEEERKARKERRRRLAEDNGSLPMEICYQSDDSSSPNMSGTGTPMTTTAPAPTTATATATAAATATHPTTNPARIYRRCCQLRETPILKKVTEQLTDSANACPTTGMVNKLDLTDCWLQLPDLITLGDYLAVVPVREIVLENSGLSDEGLRVILAGLLAAKQHPSSRRRKPKHELVGQGGVVERVVLKNNKLGPDGWKHISLFIYLCRSLKYLDLSNIAFPKQPPSNGRRTLPNGKQMPRSISDIFSTAIADRLGGAALEMLNIGETEPSVDQLRAIVDGVIKCGIRRLGLAHNCLDEAGVEMAAKYLAAGKCEGLDLGGNDLRHHMEKLAGAVEAHDTLWALSLAGCNLSPSSLCKVMPQLAKLSNFRFIDLSHNRDLFRATPSAVGLLRRYLPKMGSLRRIHLQDVDMSSEQAIAIVEVLPEVPTLAHINLLGNAEMVKLARAKTEEAQEEACALYASLLAAARISRSLICVDMEPPGDEAGEIVKAMAKQVVAYCLRNMERIPDAAIGTGTAGGTAGATAMSGTQPPYPDVLAHIVGHDVMDDRELPEDNESAPDEDYVIGGTGVVKALTCCLENRGDESGMQPGEFGRDDAAAAAADEGSTTVGRRTLAPGGKAKDMSKHLLAGARKIRIRIQPALCKARANPGDEQNLRKLTFLDETLQGIIKRFEDEFPDTREPALGSASGLAAAAAAAPSSAAASTLPTTTADDSAMAASDAEDESSIHPPKPLSRSNSMAKVLAEEEGRVHRVGHRFRSGFVRQEHLELLSSIDDIGADPNHAHVLEELAEDLGGELLVKVREKGVVRAFKEDKEMLYRTMRESDPEHWDSFVEAQQKARANMNVASEKSVDAAQPGDESAIADGDWAGAGCCRATADGADEGEGRPA